MNIQTIVAGPIHTNCYLISDQDTCLVIDPGGKSDEIEQFIGNRSLKYILLTHGHWDHLLGLLAIAKNHPETKIYLSKKDWTMAKYAVSIDKIVNLDAIFKQIQFTDNARINRLSFEEKYLQIIRTPGHTPGSVCYLLDNHLFAGDTLFKGSIGRTDLPGGNSEQIKTSLTKLAELPLKTVVYPGHGLSTTVQTEKEFGFLNPDNQQAIF